MGKQHAPPSPHLLRLALGLIFFHFGFLKFFPDLSPAEMIASQTVMRLTGGSFDARTAMWWLALLECSIGVGFLLNAGLRFVSVLFLLAHGRHVHAAVRATGTGFQDGGIGPDARRPIHPEKYRFRCRRLDRLAAALPARSMAGGSPKNNSNTSRSANLAEAGSASCPGIAKVWSLAS